MTRTSFRIRLLALVLGAGLPANTTLRAGLVVDPANDLRTFEPNVASSFAGPPNPGLDVLTSNVILDLAGNTLTFTSTMAGPISGLVDPGTGANFGTFSWGINHGYASSNFAQLGLPGVLFDAVLAVNPNGTTTYRGAQAPAAAVTASGDTLTAVLPIAFLSPPPQPANAAGPLLPVAEWSYNLWPRSTIRPDGTPIGFGDAQIADFAPDASDFRPSRPRAVGPGDARHWPAWRRPLPCIGPAPRSAEGAGPIVAGGVGFSASGRGMEL